MIGFNPAKPFSGNINKINANIFAISIKKIQKIVQDNIILAQANQNHYASPNCGPTS